LENTNTAGEAATKEDEEEVEEEITDKELMSMSLLPERILKKEPALKLSEEETKTSSEMHEASTDLLMMFVKVIV
jgi:hypothetical protein